MRVLLDENLPVGLALELPGHAVDTVSGRCWTGVKNGELLQRMSGDYDCLITMDRAIEFQQRLSGLSFGVIIVRAASNRLEHLRPLVPAILAAIPASAPGQLMLVPGWRRGPRSGREESS
jgi:hypothetical protein